MKNGVLKVDLQSLMNDLNKAWQAKRSETQVTLGKLMGILEAMPEGSVVTSLKNPHSYRGYYVDLAFERGDGSTRAADLLDVCKKKIVGQEFEGYKGGMFVMGLRTPVWVAKYGCTGERLMVLNSEGIMTAPEDEEDLLEVFRA